MENDITRHAKTACPFCGYLVDAVGPTNDEPGTPRPEHDPSLCFKCGEVLFYRADMSLRKPKPGELETIMLEDPDAAQEIARAQRQIRGSYKTHAE